MANNNNWGAGNFRECEGIVLPEPKIIFVLLEMDCTTPKKITLLTNAGYLQASQHHN